MTEYPHTTNESSSGLSRRTFRKAAGAPGAVAAVGTTQATADEETDETIVVPQLENAPAELAIGSVIPHRRVGSDVDGGVLEADSRDGDSGEYYWGNGISLSRACESAKINGTTIRATRSAISTNAHALTATGIVIESVRKSVGSAIETLSDDPIAVRFGGGKAYVSGVLNDEHGQFRQISDTRGADSAKIDLV